MSHGKSSHSSQPPHPRRFCVLPWWMRFAPHSDSFRQIVSALMGFPGWILWIRGAALQESVRSDDAVRSGALDFYCCCCCCSCWMRFDFGYGFPVFDDVFRQFNIPSWKLGKLCYTWKTILFQILVDGVNFNHSMNCYNIKMNFIIYNLLFIIMNNIYN